LSEYVASVRLLLGDVHPQVTALYPSDPRTPFDNNGADQFPSEQLITGAELLATEQVEAFLADEDRRDAMLGCIPVDSVADDACLDQIVTTLGRRALRRPMPAEDAIAYADAARTEAIEADDFYAGVGVVLSALLQHPGFLYRIELGTPLAEDANVVRLDGYDVASRLSFLVWGAPPDDALLDRAAASDLLDDASLVDVARGMLSDARAQAQAARIHAMWLGIEVLPNDPVLSEAMQNETATLVKNVLMNEERPWQDLFTEPGTYINDEMAEHYGLPAPGSDVPVYVEYPADSTRQGILSHGAFLGHGSTAGDRTPIHRGLAVRKRLMCEAIELPNGFTPPELPAPAEGECRTDLLAAHRSGGCAGCHLSMDPIGFGLEGFDGAGRPQSTEPGRPECPITGMGDLDGLVFQGPKGLSDRLLETDQMAHCFQSQYFRYALGRSDLVGPENAIFNVMRYGLATNAFTYADLVQALVSAPSFRLRRLPEVP
jgi:hypothetical protein